MLRRIIKTKKMHTLCKAKGCRSLRFSTPLGYRDGCFLSIRNRHVVTQPWALQLRELQQQGPQQQGPQQQELPLQPSCYHVHDVCS